MITRHIPRSLLPLLLLSMVLSSPRVVISIAAGEISDWTSLGARVCGVNESSLCHAPRRHLIPPLNHPPLHPAVRPPQHLVARRLRYAGIPPPMP